MVENDGSPVASDVALQDVLLRKIDRRLEKKNLRLRENLSAWTEIFATVESAAVTDRQTTSGDESGLTKREAEVLAWLREAKTGPEIAIILGCSPRTVESHIAQIYHKLDIHHRGQILFRASNPQTLKPLVAKA